MIEVVKIVGETVMKFTLPLPETTNAIYRSGLGGWYKSAKAKTWENRAGWELKRQWNKQKILGDVSVGIVFYLKRDRDIDGSIKPTLDLLERTGVIENDKYVQALIVEKKKTRGKPKMEVEIQEVQIVV